MWITIKSDEIHWESRLVGLDRLIFHVENIVQNHLQVFSLIFGFIVKVKVPSGMSWSLHSIQTWTIDLCSLINLIIFSGQDESSDREFLVLILAGKFGVHKDFILDVGKLLKVVIVAVLMLLQEGRSSL